MKKFGMLTVIVMLMAVVTTAQAEVRAGSFTVTPFIGGYTFEGNENYQDPYTYTFGLRAGYNFTKNWGVEGFFDYVPAKTYVYPITNNDNVNIGGYGIEGLYHFMPESRLVPFLAVGVGGIHYQNPAGIEDRDKFSVDYGAGLELFLPDSVAKFFMADDLALRADIRHILPLNGVYNDFLYTAGIAFSFGGKTKAVEPPAPVVAPTVEEPAPVVAPIPKVEEPAPVVVPPPAPAPKPVIIEKGRQTLDVEFDFDKSTIKKGYYKDIDSLVGVMKQYPDLNVVVEGHTDSVGTAAYNKKLSQRRAEAVKKYMVENGIDANRIKAQGFGMDKPIASNKTKEGRQKNRRVEAAVDYTIKN
jgi:OOP family OmpA-OmpF porin